MPRFCPDDFKPREKDIQWAMAKFRISRAEADRQVEEMRDYEFKRSYTDWNRVLRNWFRKGDKLGLLVKERVYKGIEEVSEEQRQADAAKAWQEMNRLKAVK